ncbi:MAG: manganese catalase family protein [Enterocloster asparagiformis]|nr:manganese catalase family protein [Enterocloster asparagiformis]
MDDQKNIACAADLPYPPVAVDGRNPAYARAMLDNIGGSNSEMSAISLYIYNNLRSAHTPDIALTFHKVSIVEMRHLEIFGKLACMLGEDPRLWTQHGCKKAYWTPGYNQYPVHFPEMMQNVIASENAAIQKYQYQASYIKDPNITALLSRIILDEQLHVQIFEQLVQDHCR